MSPQLDDLRRCMDGVIAGVVATSAPDGTPNVSFFSQVEYVDGEHVALSFQFFNKTHENILAQPFASVCVTDPVTGKSYRLDLEYLRTETSGQIFVRMKARLAGIASHEGMRGIFRLRGADIYRVLAIEAAPGAYLPPPEPNRNVLAGLRAYATHVAECRELDELIDATLHDMGTFFGIEHAMLFMLDQAADKLYAVASRGYEFSGAGAEIPLGHGVIGMAAAERCPIRICFMAPEYSYSHAVRESAAQSGLAEQLETAIPFAGLADPQSQLAVPILSSQGLIGVIYADSDEEMRFGHEDEDVVAIVAAQLGNAIAALTAGTQPEPRTVVEPQQRAAPRVRAPVRVRHFAENDSVFVDDAYLIKGVAGSILWTLLTDYVDAGRTEFSNRELRLDPRLRLPDINDNLEARLILLERRLKDRDAPIRLVKTGRGQFCLSVRGPLELEDVPRPGRT
jgi:GAF domain/Pyridoxamine 5'-phosphate oxidase